MTLGQFMKELKHTSIYISVMIENFQSDRIIIYNDTLGTLNYWIYLPKYINYVIKEIRPMMMLKGFHVLIGSDEEC